MRTVIETYNVYNYNELSDEAKKELVSNQKKKGKNRNRVWFLAQELQEFLNVMKSRNTKKTWRNDEVTSSSK